MIKCKQAIQARRRKKRAFQDFTREDWIKLILKYAIAFSAIGLFLMGCGDQQN